MFFQKNKKYELDMNTANDTLQNIFAACDKAPNTIPFDKLVLRQKANTKSYNILLVITAVLLLLTFLLPLVIVPVANSIASHITTEPTELVNDYVKDNVLYLEFTGGHILYESAYMELSDGTCLPPLSYDTKQYILCFPYDNTEEANIYIPIEDDVPLHFLISPMSDSDSLKDFY